MFSSPLLWQIQYLVTTISKKNHKAHVAELNQLVMLYGEDARAVLVNCLLEDVDLHDRANAQRDAPKVALLHDELTKLLMRPNFVSMIASAFGTDSRTISQQPQSSPVVTEEFLANLANTVKLSPSQAAALAYALTKCSNAAYAQEAMKFLVAQLPHVHSFQDVHDNAMHAIASLVGTQEELSQNQQIVDAVSAAVRATHNSADDMLHYFPTIDPLTSFLPEPPASAIDSVSKMVANSSSIASILGEFGTQCSASPDTFRLAIQETGIAVTEAQIAEILALVVRPVSGSGSTADASALYSLLPGQDGEQSRTDAKEQWHLDIVAQVLKSDYQHLDWQLVVRRLDLPIGKLPLRDAESFQHLAQLYKIVSGRDLSIDPILDNWEHPLTQFNLLKHFAFSGRDLVAGRSAGASMLPTIEGAAVPTECWLNIRFYQTLLRLADHIPSQLAMQLLQEGISKFPEYVTCGLAACQDAVSGVRAELLSHALPLFVGQSRLPTSNAVIHFLKSRNEDLLVLLYRIGFSKAVTKADITSVDAMMPRADPIRRRVETEAQFGELLPWWSVLADNGMMNDFERRLRDASRMPRNPTIAFEFVRRHLPGLRLRADEGGVLSAENAHLICELLASSRTEVPEQAVRELIQQVQKRQQMAAQNPGHAPQHGDAGQGAGQQRERRASAEIEEEANSYFQRIYTSDMSIAEVIQLLKDFKSSSNQREQEIFRCMIHNLFDEYRFFHKYPDRELQVTGRLFGTLIQHQLVSSITLGIALRYVLEALKKSPEKGGANEKMFRFGKIALEQFKSRLVEWPQYCSHLVQIPHLRELHPELYQEAYQAMTGAAPAGSSGAQAGAGTPATAGANTAAAAAASAAIQAAATAPQVAEPAADIGRGGATAFGLPPHAAAGNVPAPSHDFVAGILGSQGFAERKDDVQPVQQRTRKTIIEKLVEAHGETLNPVSPPENVRDQIHFIVNNVSKANLDQKVRELKELLSEEYYGWFAQYLVVKRITTQANLHPLYLTMLDKLDMPNLNKYILASVYHNTTKLLQSPKIISSSSERSLLRNLGSFLGQLTLGHNRPILQRDMDLKELLYWGYETGRLTAACSFVSKVLEGCKDSRIFRPPNPWLMGLLSVMREIFQIEDLRINIKFEVEVLCKNLGLKMEDIPLTSSLQRRQAPVKERNVDFSAKAAAGSTPIVGPVSPPLSGDSPEFKPSETRVPNEPTVIPNLAAYVSISPSLELFAKQPHLKRVVPVAVDRAIREIIQPVVDRSVTIACVTTKELVLKDFAFDGNENQVRNAAHLMISNLAGSLALVTCKEPLRVSMGNHLRTLLSQATSDQNDIEQIVQVCSNDNLELGCMLIEKAATEKAVRDIDEALSNAYQARRKHREQFPGQPFADTAVINKSPRLPRDLPEPLRPKTGGLQPQQLMVYEAFQRTRAQAPAPRVQQSPVLAAQQAPALQQAGKMLTPGAVPAAAAAANLTMSQAIEAYQNCLARLDVALANVLRQLQGREVTLALLGSDHEILALLREIIMVTQQTQAAVRDESALTFAESVFKRLVENTQLETLQLEVLVGILEALRDACGSKKFNPDILQWLNNYASIQIADENARKLHIMVLLLLLRAKMLKPEEADMYLYRHMEQGHNMLWVDFAMHFVRQCVYEDPSVLQAFSSTINAIQKLRVPTPAAKKQIQNWVQELFKLGASREEAAKQQAAAVGASPRQTPSPAPGAVDAVGAAAAAAAGAAPALGAGMPPTHPASLREAVTVILERWIRIWNSQNEQVYAQFLQLLHQLNVLKTEETVSKFFKTATELCVDACLKSQQRAQQQQQAQQPGAQDVAPAALNYTVIDALSRLFLLLVRLADKDPADVTGRVNLLSRILGAVGTALLEDHEAKKSNKQNFDQRPYHRLLANLLSDLGVPESKQEPNPALLPVLSTFAQTLSALQPSVAPGFAFAWLELVSHRCFMPNVLLMKDGKGWPLMHRLLISLLAFLQPFLKTVQLTDAIRKLFKGTLRVLLVLLHDFPEFLCEYHLTFCDYIPPTCVQLRNLVLSAFPRAMRLPDPFTPNLKVDLLPEINQSPRIRTDYTAELNERGIRQRLDAFLTSRQPANFLQQLPSVLMTGPNGSYNLPLMTSLVVYVGANAIMQLQTKQALQTSAAMDVYQYLVRTLDPEGRYHLLNAIANQLRYPNNHTHYFSCVMLFLFAEAGDDTIKEQITRVLLERLIVHRPHPWGLLITFIELIKNPRYEFWRQPFTRCAPEIERVFESVARSCIGSQAAGQQQQPGAAAGGDGAKATSGMASVLGGPDGSL